MSNIKKPTRNSNGVTTTSRTNGGGGSSTRGVCTCLSGFIFGVSLTVLSMSMSSSTTSILGAAGYFDVSNFNPTTLDDAANSKMIDSSAANASSTVLDDNDSLSTTAPVVTDSSSTTTAPAEDKSSSRSSVIANKNTNKYDWPGVPEEKLGVPLVKIGHNFVDNAREILLKHWDDFLAVYAARPDKVNLCGIRINHAYALWITVKTLKPTAIIESGVNAGQSTYFMRNASANAKIYAIDPEDKPICDQGKRWVDPTKQGFYYTGKKDFKDLQDINWYAKIMSGEIQPNSTLVFLDDHLSVFQRYSTFLQLGFRHIVLEDNYKIKEGATTGDKNGFTMKQMFHRVDQDTEFLFNQLISYTEFPPIVPPIMAKDNDSPRKKAGGFMVAADENTDIMAPLFRPDLDEQDKVRYEEMCKRFGIDPAMKDKDSYMQLMNYNQICYMELRPMSPYLAKKWKKAVSQG